MFLPLWLAFAFPWNISSAYFEESEQNVRNRYYYESSYQRDFLPALRFQFLIALGPLHFLLSLVILQS